MMDINIEMFGALHLIVSGILALVLSVAFCVYNVRKGNIYDGIDVMIMACICALILGVSLLWPVALLLIVLGFFLVVFAAPFALVGWIALKWSR